MNNIKARKLLQLYYRIIVDNEIADRRESILQQEKYLSSLCELRGVQYSSVKSKNYESSNPTEDSVLRMEETSKDVSRDIDILNEEIEELQRFKREMRRLFSRLSVDEMSIIEMTYSPQIRRSEKISCDTDIATALNMETEHIYRIRMRIHKKFEKCEVNTDVLDLV